MRLETDKGIMRQNLGIGKGENRRTQQQEIVKLLTEKGLHLAGLHDCLRRANEEAEEGDNNGRWLRSPLVKILRLFSEDERVNGAIRFSSSLPLSILQQQQKGAAFRPAGIVRYEVLDPGGICLIVVVIYVGWSLYGLWMGQSSRAILN